MSPLIYRYIWLPTDIRWNRLSNVSNSFTDDSLLSRCVGDYSDGDEKLLKGNDNKTSSFSISFFFSVSFCSNSTSLQFSSILFLYKLSVSGKSDYLKPMLNTKSNKRVTTSNLLYKEIFFFLWVCKCETFPKRTFYKTWVGLIELEWQM